jgi:hypothetical protein
MNILGYTHPYEVTYNLGLIDMPDIHFLINTFTPLWCSETISTK